MPDPLEQAILLLSDNRLARGHDLGLIHGSAARIRSGAGLNAATRARCYRLLADYVLPLATLGVDYESIPPVDGTRAAVEQPRPTRRIGRSKVWLDDQGLWLRSPYDARDIIRTRILSARWQKGPKAYLLPATPAAALSIADALGSFGIDADQASTDLVKQAHALKGVQARRVRTDLPPIPGTKTAAWTHQQQAFWFVRELPGAVLDVEMGGGKSKIVCDVIHDTGAESTLIVCPERVVGVWPKQIGLHCGGEKHVIDPRRQTRTGEWVLLPIAKRVEMYEHALHECGCGLPHVLISNYTASVHEPFKSWSLRQHLDYVIYDEALALDTPVPTPLGMRRIGDLAPGDEVFGADGRPTRIRRLTPIALDRPCYRVRFRNGDEVVADAGHNWWLTPQSGGGYTLKPRVVTTEELFKSDHRWAARRAAAVERPPVPLPIDPFVLGLWLGDGLHKQDYTIIRRDLLDATLAEYRRAGFDPTVSDYRNSDAVVRVGTGGVLRRMLRARGLLGCKHVPAEYLTGSVEQRLALLQGLMDSDGHFARSKSVEFSNTNEQIIDSVVALTRSLGYVPRKYRVRDERVGSTGPHLPCWKVSFSPRADRPVFRTRPVPAYSTAPPQANRVESVEPVASVPVRCIEVEAPDHLFLIGDGHTVTHNCHRIRSHSGVWSKWAAKMHSHAERHLGGTGTLQPQIPLDVFGQLRAIEPGQFGTVWTPFQKRYAIMGGFEGREFQRLNPDTEDEFVGKLAAVTYRAGEEVLDLPAMLPDLDVTSHLSSYARQAYKEMEAELYAEIIRELEDGKIVEDSATADNVLVKILRLQQITGGALPLDSGDVIEIDHSKANLLGEELEDIPASEPVVVFARFLHDLDKIREMTEKADDGRGRRYGELSGRRGDALAGDATLADGVQVAGVQIQAGGTGVDFSKSAFGIYYSVGYSLADYLQSRKRLQRPGQTRSVRFRHLVMEGTIDEDVYEALAARESVVKRIAAKVKAIQSAGTR